MSFKDIKNQDRALLFLKDAILNNRVAHAYIFFGPNGVGRKKTALNFAKALNCPSALDGDCCDQCRPCKKIDAFNHLDLFLVKPEKENSDIKIERIRSLIKDIYLKPYEGKKKVYIIDDAHLLNEESSNAILKTLEEPPSESVLILITDNISRLLSTIVSRSQIVRFFAFKTDELKDILVKEYKMDDASAQILSSLASGSLGEALKFKGAELLDKRRTLITNLSKGKFFESDLEEIPKNELKLYLDMMLLWYRDIMAAKAVGKGECRLVNIDEKESIMKEAENLKTEKIEEIINSIISTNSFLDQNANPKLAMSVLGLKILEKGCG